VLVSFLATQDMSGSFMTYLNLTFSAGRVTTMLTMIVTMLIAISHRNGSADDDEMFIPSAPVPMVDLSG
jgi:hypothetical protein